MLEFRSDRQASQARSSDKELSVQDSTASGNAMTNQDRIRTSAGSIASVGALFEACAALHAGSIALEYRDRHITYGELLDRVHRATAMLAAQGLQRGDRVALLSRNRPEYFE